MLKAVIENIIRGKQKYNKEVGQMQLKTYIVRG